MISGGFSIKGLLGIIGQKGKAMRARRIVIDAVDALLYLYDSPCASGTNYIRSANGYWTKN